MSDDLLSAAETTTIEEEVEAAESLFAPSLASENAVAVHDAQQVNAPVVQDNRPMTPVDQVMGMIAAASRDPTVDVAKMRELFGLQKDLVAMRAEQLFNEAFERMSPKLPRIKKNGQVEYKDKKTGAQEKAFRFATYEDIMAEIGPLLREEGFRFSFDTAPRQGDGGGIVVTGTLHHVAGHKERSSIPLALDASGGKNNIQGMGSTFSYGKRYTVTALLNLVAEGEDDDGKRGGMRFIDDAEQERLRAGCEATGTDPREILNMSTDEIHTFNEVTKDDYPKMLNALLSRAREQKQKGPAA